MKRKAWLLVTMLVLIGIPTGMLVHVLHRHEANRDLVQSIKNLDAFAASIALKHGADPNTRDYSNDPPRSLSDQIKSFFKKTFHPSANAAEDKHPSAFLSLFSSLQDEIGETDEKKTLPLIRTLIAAGADPNSTNQDSVSALMLSSREGHLQSFHLLLSLGANVGHKDKSGKTALHYAAVVGVVKGRCPSLRGFAGPSIRTEQQENQSNTAYRQRAGCPLQWALGTECLQRLADGL